MLESYYYAIERVIQNINTGFVNKVTLDKKITIYKVPSKNPDKYIIRIDIKN